MSKILAIKGDKERGNEVISLLEMLGGINTYNFHGTDIDDVYFVCEYKDICFIDVDRVLTDGNYVVLTLDEFYKKYPYKVGDKVTLDNKLCTIIWMCWACNNIYYVVQGTDFSMKKVTADELKPYKVEDDMKTKNRNSCANCVFAILDDKPHCGLRGFTDKFNIKDCSAENNILPNGYELQEDGYFSWVQKKPVYPKTYKECCDILNLSWNKFFVMFDIDHNGLTDAENNLYESFIKLKRCRDAYWKIAGEQMGLGKSWEPKYETLTDNTFFTIQTFNGEIDKSATSHRNSILAFPTIEMRDAFYENFKELIEKCKELL